MFRHFSIHSLTVFSINLILQIAPNPPDTAINQYVNQQGGPYFPPNTPMQWNPFMQPPYGPMPYPYGFAPFQTEYGVFVPEVPPPPPLIPVSPSPVGDLIEILKDLVPRSIFFLLAKLSALIVSLFSIGAFGGLITTVICTFTPLCTISFLPALALRNSLKQNQTVSSNIERVGRAVQLFSSAIEKYDQLQQTAKKIQNSN